MLEVQEIRDHKIPKKKRGEGGVYRDSAIVVNQG